MSAPPVTLNRIAAELEKRDIYYEQHPEFIGTSFGGILSVVLSPDLPVLTLIGRWLQNLRSDDDIEKALAFTTEFNSNKYQPRLTVEEGDGENAGTAQVMFSCTLPAGTGMTDAQLSDAVELGLHSMNIAAVDLCEQFPHLAGPDMGEVN